MSLIFLVLILVYFFSGAHQKVLNHFGLTSRDSKVMFLGVFAFGFVMAIFGLISALVAGTSVSVYLFNIAINGIFTYLNYRDL